MVNERTRRSSVYEETIAEIPRLKSGRDAMTASGMQPELAAHLMLQCASMGASIVLRAGSPPVYNQKRGPKTGLNLTKTSTQGLFKGSLAADVQFTRLDDKTHKGKGHDKKDGAHLKLPIKNPEYQHTVILPVTMQDILREVGEQGDLNVLGYEDGKLRLAYKEGKGDIDFHGQFIIDLKNGDASPLFYSRPWDRPDHHQNWDKDNQVIRKPDALMAVPDEDYRAVFSHTFSVNYSDTQASNLANVEVKEAKVFANTPRTTMDLLTAIQNSAVLQGERLEAISSIAQTGALKDVLAAMSDEEIKDVYDSSALVTTGDWDGLALGHPPALLEGFPKDEMRVFNTFDVRNKFDEMSGLMEASLDLFAFLKGNEDIQSTPLAELLNKITEPEVLFSEFALERAGCITAYEFLYQQLINYAYRDVANAAYGSQEGMFAIQAGVMVGLNKANSLQNVTNFEEKFQQCLDVALTAYEENLESGINEVQSALFKEYLTSHLKIALEKNDPYYVVPNVRYDHNTQNLFQHGFDARNPYGSNLEGAWLMVTDVGGIIYGDTQEQLIEVLLTGDFLERNHFEVNFKADMSKGWNQVVERQIELNQEISPKTNSALNLWKADSGKYQEWLNEPDNDKSNQLLNAVSLQQLPNDLPKNDVSPEAKEKQKSLKQSLHEGRESITVSEENQTHFSSVMR
jgi:hypothetical protein